MALKFRKNGDGKEVYDILPEEIPKAITTKIAHQRALNEESNGYNKSRSMRHIASVDFGIMYNWALHQGILPQQINEFYSANNCKNLMRLIKEFPDATKVVDKI
jgi:hypothetical protein